MKDFLEKEIKKCQSKTSYETKNIALREGHLILNYKEFRVYQCPYCGQWHITTGSVA